MRIHIITNLFAPDELAGAALFTDLAYFLKERGHDVRVTCTFSYYPAWHLRPEDKGVILREEKHRGIPVRRIRMYVPEKPCGRARLMSDLSFLYSLLLRARYPKWKPEVVLTAIPMLSQGLAQRFLYVGQGIPRLIVVQDFVVEAALELGILKVPAFSKFLHATQRWALRSAQTLFTISPEMLHKLRGIVGQDRRTCYVSNWIHDSLQQEINRQACNHCVRKERTLFYAGNVGVKQGLPDFLNQFRDAGAANLGWQLAIHGGGADRERLATETARTPGCHFGPVLAECDYIAALRSTSACLVTQRPGVGANFLPSKILPALATGTPVLALCERASPLGREVSEGGFGEVVTPANPAMLAKTLARWNHEPELFATLGTKASERAKLYHRNKVLPQYEAELIRLVANAEPGCLCTSASPDFEIQKPSPHEALSR
jgi:colanic acid biosynthesis glycosyl transferase WcaI